MSFKFPAELSVLIYFFAYMLTASIFTNLIVYRTCYITLGYNETACASLGNKNNGSDENRQKLEKLVEPTAAIINTLRNSVEGVFTSFMCTFIGPWSDKYGRKPVLIATMTGFTLNFISMAIFAALPLSPWYSIACVLPLILTGSSATYLTVIISSITDSSNEDNRGTRMAIFEGAISLGILIGNVSSPYILYATNYEIVFLIAASSCFLGLLHIIFLVPESLQHRETQGKLRNLFRGANFTDMLKTTFKQRENHKRTIVLLSVAILTTYIFIIYGDGAVTFFFLRSKFDWSLTKYQMYSSAHNVVWILGTVLGSYVLNKLLKITESVLAFTGILSMMACALVLGLAQRDWLVYASIGLRTLGGTISPMMRTLVSKMVSAEEIGKIFALIMASEFFFGLGAGPLYTLVYDETIDKDPGIFNFLSGGLYGVSAVFISVIMYLEYKNGAVPYEELKDDE